MERLGWLEFRWELNCGLAIWRTGHYRTSPTPMRKENSVPEKKIIVNRPLRSVHLELVGFLFIKNIDHLFVPRFFLLFFSFKVELKVRSTVRVRCCFAKSGEL